MIAYMDGLSEEQRTFSEKQYSRIGERHRVFLYNMQSPFITRISNLVIFEALQVLHPARNPASLTPSTVSLCLD